MKRVVSTLLILLIGSLVLWEAFAWGTRVWMRYGLMKEPLPSLTTFLTPTLTLQLLPMLTTFAILLTAVATAFRARKLFGLIPVKELERHMVVLGPTGSGKTTVAKAIIDRVAESASIVIIDWKGEYVEYLKPMRPTVVRKIPCLWDVPGDSPREKALVAVELIREMSKDTVEISPPSSLLLLRVLTEEYERGVPTTEKIVKVLERHAEIAQREGRYAESNMHLALIRRLFVLLVDEEREAENEIVEDSKVIIYDLGGLPSIYLKTLYSGYVLASVYREAMKAGMSDGLKTLLIAEEAQNYIARRPGELPSMAERTVYELRSFGVGVILVCPDPELLPPSILKDVGTIIATSPDSLPRFVLERHLFRASLEEAEDTLKKLKKSRLIVYYAGKLHYFRRLPKPPKLKELRLRPKGDRMGVTDPGGRSLRAWPILPHRSPGRPATEVKKEDIEERSKVIEIREVAAVEEKPKVVEVVEELKLEEEELEEPEAIEAEVEKSSKPIEVKKEKVSEEEKEVMVEEEVPIAVELEPAPEGPPIPSTLPYRGSLCSAGRSTTLGGALLLEEDKNSGWWVSGKVGTKFPVGDPLTPGGGPGRAELRLEEEEGVEKVIEGEATESQVQREEVSETPSQQGWELFGHLLVEDLQVRGRTSVMRCARCGASAPLTGLKALREIPCTPKEVVRAEKLTKKCENCGREATASLCDECADAFEKYAEIARPAPLRERGGIKPPNVPGVDGWAWVSSLTTFFPFRKLEGGGREWWCPVPGCKVTARRLIDVVDHFKDAHPILASRGWYEEFDTKTKKTRIRTWQGWIDEEKLELVLEPEVEKR